MKAVDTNVLARFILQDDDRQTELARTVLSDAVWIADSVWVELGWVLHRRLRLDRAVVADSLATVLMMETVHVADRSGLSWAIERYRQGADWADAVHLVASRGAASAFATFDRGIAQSLHDGPVAIETLA